MAGALDGKPAAKLKLADHPLNGGAVARELVGHGACKSGIGFGGQVRRQQLRLDIGTDETSPTLPSNERQRWPTGEGRGAGFNRD